MLTSQIILAVYYTLADIVLLAQCFYYRGFTLSDAVPAKEPENDEENGVSDERAPLLSNGTNGTSHSPNQRNGGMSPGQHANGGPSPSHTPARISDMERRGSGSSFRERLLSLDGTHFSPVTPLHGEVADDPLEDSTTESGATGSSRIRKFFLNLAALLVVCAAGVLGWWLSGGEKGNEEDENPGSELHFSVWGQIFGYICALLYLGSRIPQLLLNYRRKSTEGISMLFFLFACIGNLTYVLSIVAYAPPCWRTKGGCDAGQSGREYGTYIAVNLSWLIGSFGTLLLDLAVFVQFFIYQKVDDETDDESS
jgi:solute carrier family 66 (lysosomal lysine-arginine transporter), member 1